MTKTVVELCQLAILSAYLLTAWSRETQASKAILAWWIGVLAIDIFIWRGHRPPYAKEFLNCFDVGIGLVLMYAKLKNLVKKYVQLLLAVVLCLFR
jgi:hypothetical protein